MHRYKLQFTDLTPIYVTADSAADAVRSVYPRHIQRPPHIITDMTQLDLWAKGLSERRGIHMLYEEVLNDQSER